MQESTSARRYCFKFVLPLLTHTFSLAFANDTMITSHMQNILQIEINSFLRTDLELEILNQIQLAMQT